MSAIANLPGYQITEQLYIGTRTLVYRGIRSNDQQPVAIKLLRNDYPNFNELVQFRNQYTIAKNLDYPNIIKPFILEEYRNGYALIMEDFGGIALSNYLYCSSDDSSKSKYLHLVEFLEIAIQLAETLHYLYQNRVIHKDIKPANVLINLHTKQVKLIDFSIASLLPRETQELQNANNLEGTLAYLSPEQTGRMNRGIDYRTDFYSLGVTFYELLTGTLPFVSEDPMELVHGHLAKQPIPIHQINAEIPLILSEIVSKLMAKNAENRYQSALGIKHDLEICLAQLQTTGIIEPFEIGKQDISDRFLIPEKLYGREVEVNQLLNAFDRVADGTTEMMLVAGFSGIGKTAVINEVHKPIVKQRGYFIKGKYDQFQRNIPLSAFVQAFRDLIGQLLSESDEQLQRWKINILEALGDNGQVLIDVIPELENIIGKQPPATELSGTSAQNRFNFLLQKFVQIFTSKEHPLVMFLDDLQWADSASLNLLKLLMQDSGYLLILGAYRDNEVSPVHPFILTVDEIRKTAANVNTITLPPLRKSDINQLVADTLNCEFSVAQPLSKLVYQKTKGNPFFATQFLKALHDENLITFNWNIQHWQCNIAQVKALAITDDVVKFMALQLQKLPQETQDILKLAACIGADFDLNTLAIVSQKSPQQTATYLWKALQEGLLIPTTKIYKFFTQTDSEEVLQTSGNPTYQFLHDRVQQAAYSLIPEEQKQITHLNIGRLLLLNTPEAEWEEIIFLLVLHLNIASDLITTSEERAKLSQLNLIAGRKAKTSTAYEAAIHHLDSSIKLLSDQSWSCQYKFTLELFEQLAEAAYLNSNFQKMEEAIDRIFANAQNLLDKIPAYEIQIGGLTAQDKAIEALETGIAVLKKLGIFIPLNPSENDFSESFQQSKKLWEGQDPLSLINLPMIDAAIQLAATKILTALIPPAYFTNATLFCLLVFEAVKIGLQYGHANSLPFPYACYGFLLIEIEGKIEQGYRFGKLAIEVAEKLNDKEAMGKAIEVLNGHIQHWKAPLTESLNSLLQGYYSSLDAGDLEYASYNSLMYCYHAYFAGYELSIVEQEMKRYGEAIQRFNHAKAVYWHNIYYQSVINLLSFSPDPECLSGHIYNELESLPLHLKANDSGSLGTLYLNKTILGYLLKSPEQALVFSEKTEQYLGGLAGQFGLSVWVLYDSLIRLNLIFHAPEIQRQEYLEKIVKNQNKMGDWAQNSPSNFQHKLDLIEAEKQRIFGNKAEAIDYYDRAISGARENRYIQEEALANELAAKFYLDWGKVKIAQDYMQEAYYCYARWGAKAKVADLEQQYPQLLEAILQATNPALNSKGTISPTLMRSATSTSSNSLNLWLNFPSVIKAAQAISEEIELEKLLATLLKIAIDNAGAQSGILITYQAGKWLVVLKAKENNIENQQIPLNECEKLPQSLIYSVVRSGKMVVFDNLSADAKFAGDRYIITHQPKSVLCTPISKQGKLIAILYLENNLTVGAFTNEQRETLQLLSAQAAISIENASLYQQVENYSRTLEAEVERKTEQLSQKAADLEQALQNLQQTQSQLIQSEKMSALGQLVAGIAHEINNPVNFIYGNLHPTENYLQDLLSLLKLYQQEYPKKNSVIQAKIEEIDLDFIRDDFLKILHSMKVGSKRIKQIILSLRNFSRLYQFSVTMRLIIGMPSGWMP